MKKILVIEDEKNIRNRIVDTLELSEEPYQVFAAQDGREGLEMARREVPDLIISDVMMPNMDGFETIELMRKRKFSARYIMVSADAMDSTMQKAISLNIEYMTKPVVFSVLKSIIES